MGGSSRLCQVCNGAQSNYKCPFCLLPYCSLVCYKKHKAIPCSKPESAEEKPKTPFAKTESVEEESTAILEFQPERPVDVDGPSEVLQKLQLEAIASSSEIRDALKDEHLQKLICDIDKSPDPLNELEKAMGTDVFCIFTDKILSAIKP